MACEYLVIGGGSGLLRAAVRRLVANTNDDYEAYVEAMKAVAGDIYRHISALAGIESIWALGLEAYESAREEAECHAREINRRDFSPIRPAGTCYFRRSARAKARAGLPGKRDRLRGGDEVA